VDTCFKTCCFKYVVSYNAQNSLSWFLPYFLSAMAWHLTYTLVMGGAYSSECQI
jgi:hypothetical protein